MTQKPKKSDDANLAELEQIRKDLEEMRSGWQRTQADFENFRRRTQTEQTQRTMAEVSRALADFLPVAENLRRSLAEMQAKPDLPADIAAWVSGVSQVARQFDQALTNAGVTPIDPKDGEPFNPNEHEAISQLPHDEHPADTVLHVIERGYKVGDRVVVPAKVVVSAGKQR